MPRVETENTSRCFFSIASPWIFPSPLPARPTTMVARMNHASLQIDAPYAPDVAKTTGVFGRRLWIGAKVCPVMPTDSAPLSTCANGPETDRPRSQSVAETNKPVSSIRGPSQNKESEKIRRRICYCFAAGLGCKTFAGTHRTAERTIFYRLAFCREGHQPFPTNSGCKTITSSSAEPTRLGRPGQPQTDTPPPAPEQG